jgi:hypothetical protein
MRKNQAQHSLNVEEVVCSALNDPLKKHEAELLSDFIVKGSCALSEKLVSEVKCSPRPQHQCWLWSTRDFRSQAAAPFPVSGKAYGLLLFWW